MTDDHPSELSGFLDFGTEALEEAASLLRRYFRKTISTGPFGVQDGDRPARLGRAPDPVVHP